MNNTALKSTALKSFTSKDAQFFYQETPNAAKPLIIWGHGWGQSHQAFNAMIAPLKNTAQHISLDFPGFGESPSPPSDWGTEDYADALANWVKANDISPIYWVGHSFGGRVGIQLAARHPDLIKTLFIIAGAGLKRKRSPLEHLRYKARIYSYKLGKQLIKWGLFSQDKLRQKFGSADYLNAGEMRNIFVKVVNEDLSEAAKSISCETLLFYGENDTETPPEFGLRFEKLIPKARATILPNQDHYSVLQNGRHNIISAIQAALKKDEE